MSNMTRPAAGDGGSRQCIGSRQNQAGGSKATPNKTQAALPIDQIIVGDRAHRDLGYVAEFATSFAEIGLLNPSTVDENRRLLTNRSKGSACACGLARGRSRSRS